MGSRKGLSAAQAEKYLDAGYTIISIDYRLAPQAKVSQILEDLDDAYRWVRSEGPKLFLIDPNRIAVIRALGGRLPGLDRGLSTESPASGQRLLLRLR